MQSSLDDSDILKNIKEHLLHLASDTAQIGTSVSCLTNATDDTLSPSIIKDLQKLDSLQQSLCDLAGLVAALAGPDENRPEAVSRLKLKATRTLVRRAAGDDLTVQGTVDLF